MLSGRVTVRYADGEEVVEAGESKLNVEGYVDIPELHVPIEHAWIEVDGRVAEIAFSDTRPNRPPG